MTQPDNTAKKPMSTKSKMLLGLTGLMGIAAIYNLAVYANPNQTDPEGARQILEDSDYTNVEIGGYAWFGCNEGDSAKTKFTATNSKGRDVEGIVCKDHISGAQQIKIIAP